MGYAAPAIGIAYYLGGAYLVSEDRHMELILMKRLLLRKVYPGQCLPTLLKRLVGRERPYVTRDKLGEIDASAVDMARSEQLLFPEWSFYSDCCDEFFYGS